MPQRKITSPIEATDLPDISEADQEFARLVALGKGSLTDALRASRDVSDWASTTVWAYASRLRANANVSAWIDAFRSAGVGASSVTFERHVAELERLKALSVKSGNMGAAVQCEQTIGKAAGLHVEQVRDVTQRTDPADLLRDIAASGDAATKTWAEAQAAALNINLNNASTTRH